MARAAREAVVVAPSPLAGEGMKNFPQLMAGEGGRPLDDLNPSPIRVSWNRHRALSRKGRGRSNARLRVGLS